MLSLHLSTFMCYQAAVAAALAKFSSLLYSAQLNLKSSRQILTRLLCCWKWATKKMTRRSLCKSHRTIWNKPALSCSTTQTLLSPLVIKSPSLQTIRPRSLKQPLPRPQPAVVAWSTSMLRGSPRRLLSELRRFSKT